MTPTTRTISITTTILGVLVLAAMVVSAFMPLGGGLFSGSGAGGGHTASPEGIRELRVDSADAEVHIAFADVGEARLDVSGRDSAWRMSTSGDTLKVTNDRLFGGWCFMWCDSHREQVTITLPAELEGALGAKLQMASGRMDVDGDFAGLAVEVAAGAFTYAGAAARLDVDISAGNADLVVEGAEEVRLEVAAGELTTTLQGTPPSALSAELAAGSLDLTLPDVAYRVTTDVALGSIDNRLRTSGDSAHTVDVEITAGRATLRPGE